MTFCYVVALLTMYASLSIVMEAGGLKKAPKFAITLLLLHPARYNKIKNARIASFGDSAIE